MEIEVKDKLVNLIDVEHGACFLYKGEYYMKIILDGSTIWNCVFLKSGRICSLDGYAKVNLVDAKVVIG